MYQEPLNQTCPTDEIAAYIDGELTPAREIELEVHLAVCTDCLGELNLQKQFLCDLDSGLRNEGEIELPSNFAKLVATNAESSVAGLRGPRERYNALFICAALVLFGLFALGADAARVFDGVTVFLDQTAAVGGFFGRVIYSVFLGLTIILRALATRLSDDGGVIVAWTVVAILVAFVSRKVLQISRV